jgi:hypothetical protein
MMIHNRCPKELCPRFNARVSVSCCFGNVFVGYRWQEVMLATAMAVWSSSERWGGPFGVPRMGGKSGMLGRLNRGCRGRSGVAGVLGGLVAFREVLRGSPDLVLGLLGLLALLAVFSSRLVERLRLLLDGVAAGLAGGGYADPGVTGRSGWGRVSWYGGPSAAGCWRSTGGYWRAAKRTYPGGMPRVLG